MPFVEERVFSASESNKLNFFKIIEMRIQRIANATKIDFVDFEYQSNFIVDPGIFICAVYDYGIKK